MASSPAILDSDFRYIDKKGNLMRTRTELTISQMLSFLDEDYEKQDMAQEIVSPIPAAKLFSEKTQIREEVEDMGRTSGRAEEEKRQDGVVIT